MTKKDDGLNRRKGSHIHKKRSLASVRFSLKCGCFYLGVFLLIGLLCGYYFVLDHHDVGNWKNRHVDSSHEKSARNSVVDTTSSRRFPLFGSAAFRRTCPWVTMPQENTPQTTNETTRSCTIYAVPKPNGSEGLAEWVELLAIGYIEATLKNCHFTLSYGPNVDVSQILIPVSSHWNWTLPIPQKNFTCHSSRKCWYAKRQPSNILNRNNTHMRKAMDQEGFVHIPSYRHPFVYQIYKSEFKELMQRLPGFDLATGFACAMGALFQLAQPRASQFQPDLFSYILPTLRNTNENLVLTLYVRTGRTDRMASAELKGTAMTYDVKKPNPTISPQFIDCVQQIETKLLQEANTTANNNKNAYQRVIWLLISDSVPLKTGAIANYQGQEAAHGGIPRSILTTTSRGIHTRGARNPSTADFAEGVLDWYLMGESDAVITINLSHSFGTTAAIRTATPLYSCHKQSQSTVPLKWV
eukprot:CAMPEP_0198282916 /NCGR_PEP_ID=MMETSP1449-20131203/2627_1 /TAXON_ID=420275 /ORGANISM="Attheya septentrionalis, Strain CCMP2084" /LENGTH=468 /DNA_ID=CAMNT_0043979335 /DNA_START=151 /DNA_END=1554 /DNA_ORIENTATION=-